jgi:hypothetical protein
LVYCVKKNLATLAETWTLEKRRLSKSFETCLTLRKQLPTHRSALAMYKQSATEAFEPKYRNGRFQSCILLWSFLGKKRIMGCYKSQV